MPAPLPASGPAGPDSPKITLVIGSGGARCAAALGVVKALADAGIGVERVVGCSAGAVFAALVAFGYTIDESKAVAMRLWERELAARRSMFGMLHAVAPRLFRSRAAPGFGLRDDRIPLQHLAAAFGNKCIEAAVLPLHLTATDFATGELVELAKGPLVGGLRASLSLPPAMAPQLAYLRQRKPGAGPDTVVVNLFEASTATLHAFLRACQKAGDQCAFSSDRTVSEYARIIWNVFFVPQFGTMIYTMPRMTTRLHLQADRPGVYDGISAHFSGDGFPVYSAHLSVSDDQGATWSEDAAFGRVAEVVGQGADVGDRDLAAAEPRAIRRRSASSAWLPKVRRLSASTCKTSICKTRHRGKRWSPRVMPVFTSSTSGILPPSKKPSKTASPSSVRRAG